MTINILNTCLLSTFLIACQTKVTSDQRILPESDTLHTTSAMIDSPAIGDSSEAATEVADDSGCIRGQAEPIVRKTIYPNAEFKLNDDNHSGTETVDLENGDRLIINNWGCEYYILTFRFETSRFDADTTDIISWLDSGLKLMTGIEQGIDSYHVTQGMKGMKNFLTTSKTLKLGEEIIFDDGEIRHYATVDRIQQVEDRRYALEISFVTGPL